MYWVPVGLAGLREVSQRSCNLHLMGAAKPSLTSGGSDVLDALNALTFRSPSPVGAAEFGTNSDQEAGRIGFKQNPGTDHPRSGALETRL